MQQDDITWENIVNTRKEYNRRKKIEKFGFEDILDTYKYFHDLVRELNRKLEEDLQYTIDNREILKTDQRLRGTFLSKRGRGTGYKYIKKISGDYYKLENLLKYTHKNTHWKHFKLRYADEDGILSELHKNMYTFTMRQINRLIGSINKLHIQTQGIQNKYHSLYRATNYYINDAKHLGNLQNKYANLINWNNNYIQKTLEPEYELVNTLFEDKINTLNEIQKQKCKETNAEITELETIFNMTKNQLQELKLKTQDCYSYRAKYCQDIPKMKTEVSDFKNTNDVNKVDLAKYENDYAKQKCNNSYQKCENIKTNYVNNDNVINQFDRDIKFYNNTLELLQTPSEKSLFEKKEIESFIQKYNLSETKNTNNTNHQNAIIYTCIAVISMYLIVKYRNKVL